MSLRDKRRHREFQGKDDYVYYEEDVQEAVIEFRERIIDIQNMRGRIDIRDLLKAIKEIFNQKTMRRRKK